jgi:hypothetical protein
MGQVRQEPWLDTAPLDAATPASLAPVRATWMQTRDYSGPFAFFLKHWRGDYSLARSYWLNSTLASVAILVVANVVNPWVAQEYTARLTSIWVLALTVLGALVLVWSIGGTWFSANKHVERGGSKFWAGAARIALALAMLRAIVQYATIGPQVAEHIKVASGYQPGPDVTIKLLPDGATARYEGGVNDHAAEQLRRFIDQHPGLRTVVLSSPGGWTREGERLAKVIADRKLDTYVEAECSSSCTIAFLAGAQRAAAPTALLGFHRFRRVGSSSSALARQFDDEATRRAYLAAGLSNAFIQKVNETRPDDVWYPTSEELLSYGVVTRRSQGGETASFAERVTSREALVAELKKTPLLQSIATKFPLEFQRIADEAWVLLQAKRSDAEVMQPARSAVTALFVKLIPAAADPQIVAYAQLMLDEARALAGTNPHACVALMFPGEQRTDAGSSLSRELIKRDRALTTQVILEAQPNAQAPVIDQQARQALRGVAASLAPSQLRLITSAEERGHTLPSTTCAASIAFLRALLAVPEKNRAMVVRAAFFG